MEISKIENLIKQAAASRNAVYEENGNTALQAQQTVKEPIVPLTANPVVPERKAETPIQLTQQQALKQFIRTNLREGIDYGQIPGVKNNVLFKPGAAKILAFLHLTPHVELLHTVFDPAANVISYTIKVTLVNNDGEAITEALGAANTLETKFVKAGMGAQNLVASQAVKRATVSAIKNLIC